MPTTVRTQPVAGSVQQGAEPQVLLGRYRVLETNTQGGFGTVNVCWDARLQRRVAIKCMPLYEEGESAARISTIDEALAEARTSAMLDHRNIVAVHDFATDGTRSYLVMEYVDGLNLAELLARVEGGVLTFDECAHLVDSLASALAFAHENGVLHLDIKPANIMIDRAGTVKLGDFGMATLASAAGFGGARGGTVGYMPPEQIEGDYVDERTDVFSLAVVVWHALTGRCPYAASTPEESLRLIKHGPSPTLSHVEPDLAGIVEETLLRALSPDPRARMTSIEEFALDLVPVLGDVEEGAQSLADLITQTEEHEPPRPVEDWERLRVPLTVQFPWLGGACVRLLATSTAAWAAYQVIPLVIPNSRSALAFGVGGIAAASAIWPPLSGTFGIASLLAGLLTQPTRLSFALALGIGLVGFVWWVAMGRRCDLAGAALLLPACLNAPLAGVGISAFALGPGSALVTGTGSWALWLVFRTALGVGFDPNALGEALREAALAPHTWILAASCGLASCLGALLARRRTLLTGILAQALAIGVLLAGYAAIAHVENTSIGDALDGPSLVIAVILGATLSIAHALAGEHVPNTEGDDRA